MDENPTGLHKFFETVEPETVLADFPSDQLLVNDEEQNSLWPAKMDVSLVLPSFFKSPQQACLNHVESAPMDMRPKSIRD